MSLADIHIDTTGASPADLRQTLLAKLGMTEEFRTQVRLLSFSYRRRLPDHSDLVIDMRFASNPHWKAELRQHDGRHADVAAFLEADKTAVSVIESVKVMLGQILPRMSSEGRPILTIAFGCTGGKHRSVYIVEKLKIWLAGMGERVRVSHRDLNRER